MVVPAAAIVGAPERAHQFFHSYLPEMNFLANIIWLLFGGLWSALGYIIGGVVLCLTIVGIPFGLQCFKLAEVVLWPFGRQIVNDPGDRGCLTALLNIIWIFCGGLWIAVGHLVFGALLCVTIIGIPFGVMHFRLIELSLMPFGKRVI
jgi:uncharacterized membrane protein YccF (DUF307 family)